ncbi:MAG: hypothetical protein MSIBF_04295 [Candidatus Altiarchaeales archaeon IMC4]|nr:MAG: hypothetical protein MSIBF_04295 [Candidatus Altiarchaeales archaeon IMC4]
MSSIKALRARKVLDSRGNPTIEVDIITDGLFRAAAPSGASCGEHEAVSFPKSVDECVSEVKDGIAKRIVGRHADVVEIDKLLREIDGTGNFSRIGGNPAVAISMAVAKAEASSKGIPLYAHVNKLLGSFGCKTKTGMPMPLGNVLGGGAHAVGGTNIQEFLVVSQGKTASESVFANAQVHKRVKEKLMGKYPGIAIGKGDEGAWVARVDDEEALEIVSSACSQVGDESGVSIKPGLDMAASELWDGKKKKYIYRGVERTNDEQIDFVLGLIEDYRLYYVEDPMEQNDFDGFARLTKKAHCLVCGDDLFVTNAARFSQGIKIKAANSILIKPNQIGTMSDMLMAVALAINNGYAAVVSHRSGETADDTIAHIAFGVGAQMIKTGAVGGERIAKLNELIRIEEGLYGN